jgi:hypothetical protein
MIVEQLATRLETDSRPKIKESHIVSEYQQIADKYGFPIVRLYENKGTVLLFQADRPAQTVVFDQTRMRGE